MYCSSNDIIPLLSCLEEQITHHPVKLPIVSCNTILHIHTDIPPEKHITNEDLLFRVYDVIRDDLNISKEEENKIISLCKRIISGDNPNSTLNCKMLYLLILLCHQQNNKTNRKRRIIHSEMYKDDESIWFSRKAIACANQLQDEITMVDKDNPFGIQKLSSPSSVSEDFIFTTKCISKNYLPHITNDMLE